MKFQLLTLAERALPVLDCLPLNGESGVEPFRTFRRGGATGALKVAASPFGGSGGRKGAGCSVIAWIFIKR